MPIGSSDTASSAPYAVEERSVQLLVNGAPAACFHCTPLQLEEMAVGWLLGEGLAPDAAAVGEVVVDEELLTVSVPLITVQSEAVLTASRPAGDCGQPSAADIPPEPDRAPPSISRLLSDREALRSLFRRMFDRAVLREAGGGIHTGALVHGDDVLIVVEDVGRHNLVDKIIGFAARSEIPLRQSLVLLSARVSGAIALKLWRTGVPAVATISVPTTMAREIAMRCGIRIVGRCLKQNPLRYPVAP